MSVLNCVFCEPFCGKSTFLGFCGSENFHFCTCVSTFLLINLNMFVFTLCFVENGKEPFLFKFV